MIKAPSAPEEARQQLLSKYGDLLREFTSLRRAPPPNDPEYQEKYRNHMDAVSRALTKLEDAGRAHGLSLEMEQMAALAEPETPTPRKTVPDPRTIQQFFQKVADRETSRPSGFAPSRPPVSSARPSVTTSGSTTQSVRPSTAQEVREHGTESFASMGRDFHRTAHEDGVRYMQTPPGFKRDLIEMLTLGAVTALMAIGTYYYQKVVARGHRPFG